MTEESFRYAARLLNENHRSNRSPEGIEFQIFYWGMDWAHLDNPVHRHSFYEICYVLEGSGTYDDDGTIYPLQDGSLFVSLPGHWHQIRSGTGLKMFFVAFEIVGAESPFLKQRYESAIASGPAPVIVEPEGVAALLWRALYLLSLEGREDHARQERTLCSLLLSSFPSTFGLRDPSSPARPRSVSRSPSHLVQLARRFIRDNLSRPLRLEDVAAYLSVSPRHLSRLFKEETTNSFVHIVHQERLLVAESLLKTTLLSIKEIADMTGYQSLHYFTRVFSNRFGKPPAEFRKLTFSASTRSSRDDVDNIQN